LIYPAYFGDKNYIEYNCTVKSIGYDILMYVTSKFEIVTHTFKFKMQLNR